MIDTEILVHISAPGGVGDDARYRRQVQAYLDFQAISRHSVFGLGGATGTDSGLKGTISCNALPCEDGTQLGLGEAFATIGTGNCPPLREGSLTFSGCGQPEQRASLDNVESCVKDSGPPSDRENGVLCSKRTCITGLTSSDQKTAPCTTPPGQPARSEGLQSSSALNQSNRSQFDSLGVPLSVVQDSQPLLMNTQSAGGEHQDWSEHEPSEHIQVARSFSVGARSPDLNISQGAVDGSKTKGPDVYPSSHLQQDVVTAIKRVGKLGEHNVRLASIKGHEIHEPLLTSSLISEVASVSMLFVSLSTLPLEIHPPPPPVSTEKFRTHVTPTLQMLVERLKPSQTFNPHKQNRALAMLERGYWSFSLNVLKSDAGVNRSEEKKGAEQKHGNMHRHQQTENNINLNLCNDKTMDDSSLESIRGVDWPFPLFVRFWTFLTDFIARDGRAGWGVWCILEETKNQRYTERVTGLDMCTAASVQSMSQLKQPLTVKVYAWGEIAPHIYLLLFLASERRIRGMKAQWRDGSDEVVIQMP